MKRLVCVLLCAVFLLLAGCGNGVETSGTPVSSTLESAAAETEESIGEADGTEAALTDMPVEEKERAVPQSLVNVFGMPSDAALAELGLADAPYDEEAGGIVAEYTWCGVPMETVINPNWLETGEIVSITGRTVMETGAETGAFMQSCVEQFTEQFGTPINYSTEISGEGRFGHVYDEQALEGILADFSALDADCALTFRFMLPGRGEEDLEFAECAFYKSSGTEPVTISLHMLRLYEPDYEVTETPPYV